MVILSGFSCCVPQTMNHQTVELHGTLLNRFSHKKMFLHTYFQRKAFCVMTYSYMSSSMNIIEKNSILFHVIY